MATSESFAYFPIPTAIFNYDAFSLAFAVLNSKQIKVQYRFFNWKAIDYQNVSPTQVVCDWRWTWTQSNYSAVSPIDGINEPIVWGIEWESAIVEQWQWPSSECCFGSGWTTTFEFQLTQTKYTACLKRFHSRESRSAISAQSNTRTGCCSIAKESCKNTFIL